MTFSMQDVIRQYRTSNYIHSIKHYIHILILPTTKKKEIEHQCWSNEKELKVKPKKEEQSILYIYTHRKKGATLGLLGYDIYLPNAMYTLAWFFCHSKREWGGYVW